MNTENQGIDRRSLAKGAAWAAPAVLATTTVPAYAASRCGTMNGSVSRGFVYWNGTSRRYNTQTMDHSAGRVFVNNIPANRTVAKIETILWIEQRDQARTFSYGIMPFNSADTALTVAIRQSGTAVTRIARGTESGTFVDRANGNWTGNRWRIVSTGRNINHPIAGTLKSWGLGIEWNAGVAGDPRIPILNYNSNRTCYNFVLPEMGRMYAEFYGVLAGSDAENQRTRNVLRTRVTLDNDEVIYLQDSYDARDYNYYN